ncbi:MAG: hypothetical protein LUM44_11080 [Pyrinomonadaceae bacterium]|nr:hypothetical protein [Pyrinomonadaceae bacterium]
MKPQIFNNCEKCQSAIESPLFGRITFTFMGVYLWFLQFSNYLLKLVQ